MLLSSRSQHYERFFPAGGPAVNRGGRRAKDPSGVFSIHGQPPLVRSDLMTFCNGHVCLRPQVLRMNSATAQLPLPTLRVAASDRPLR